LADLIGKAGLEAELPAASTQDLMTVFYPVVALEAIDLLADAHRYQVLVVDEGQDLLLTDYVLVMDRLLVGGLQGGAWRVFLDSAQDLFSGFDRNALRRFVGENPASFKLTRNCRNTKQIAAATAILSSTPLVSASAQGPDVEFQFYRDAAELRRAAGNAVNRLLSDRLPLRELTVLSPVHLDKSELKEGLDGVRPPLIDASDRDDHVEHVISFRTIQSFKGLESDAVFLVDLKELDDPATRSAAYVGASRARVLLTVFLPESLKPEFLRHAEEFGGHQADCEEDERASAE
jgi:superfamily I DNA/RNA helicase